MNTPSHEQPWDEVLQFWFPEGRFAAIASNAHREHWFWRMRGGADGEVIARFSDMTAQAAAGNLDHWATDPEGRLALIILLDQFSRSVWRGSHAPSRRTRRHWSFRWMGWRMVIMRPCQLHGSRS